MATTEMTSHSDPVNFSTLVGKTVDLYGCDNGFFCIGLDGNRMVFCAEEDESDGYRSMMDEVRHVEKPEIEQQKPIFFDTPVAKVEVTEPSEIERYGGTTEFNGYQLRDVSDGHVWLTLGTRNWDDYYPCYTFEWNAKKKSE